MQMWNFLSPIRASSEEEFIPFLRNIQVAGDIPSDENHLSNEGAIVVLKVRNTRDRSLGNNENMNRGEGINIAKRNKLVIFKENIGWYLFADNFLKDRGHITLSRPNYS